MILDFSPSIHIYFFVSSLPLQKFLHDIVLYLLDGGRMRGTGQKGSFGFQNSG